MCDKLAVGSSLHGLILGFAMLLSVPMFAACGHTSTTRSLPVKGQIITISDSIVCTGGADTVRFGRMRSGETAVKALVLHNTSKRPIVITDYTRTCACTTFEFGAQPIAPHGKASVRLLFDSRGLHGWQFKVIEVRLANASSPLKIYIDAEVE